ncbi:amidohydrolase family protein [Methanoplanus sp. FWC-SCC4]|uniref:Amidohydrolase family protein n=1 Tax=Methanochimaera problematica TaxID=2609417 RepID=A0AA97I2V7_9EURY|nr:dihydroorotase [Methanoplanus sp. FWC-SCC4]WOF16003.1 amidohydrolase family protein [Methanoplanus sp. FWC-SCC4]
MVPDCNLVLKNVRIPNGRIADISIAGGRVIHIGSGLPSDRVIDCFDYLCLPGGVDMHVHMRGGKEQSYKETWETGTKSAIAGGVATVVDQPNTIPPVLSRETFAERLLEAKSQSLCNYGINGGIFSGCDVKGMYESGALAFGEIFAAESSYGSAIGPDELKKYFLKILNVGGLATVHAESVAKGNDNSLNDHSELRSETGEAAALKAVRDMAPLNLRLHFCHLSTPESVKFVSGIPNTTCEVMPHHLFLSIEMFDQMDGKGKVNPPLRHEGCRKDLWKMWDMIDVIASDHAPHLLSEKTGDFSKVPSGMPGAETMIPLFIPHVFEKRINLNSLIEKTVINPAKILGIPSAGYETGCRADFALYPRRCERIQAEMLHSKAGWTPYEGMKAVFPEIMIINGEIVFNMGEFVKGSGQWIFGDGYIPYNSK